MLLVLNNYGVHEDCNVIRNDVIYVHSGRKFQVESVVEEVFGRNGEWESPRYFQGNKTFSRIVRGIVGQQITDTEDGPTLEKL